MQTERGDEGGLVKVLTSDGEERERPDFGAQRTMEMAVGESTRSNREQPGKLGLQLGGIGGRTEEAELRELLTAGGDGRTQPESGRRWRRRPAARVCTGGSGPAFLWRREGVEGVRLGVVKLLEALACSGDRRARRIGNGGAQPARSAWLRWRA
jgi:hypothetical protein